MPYQSVFRQNLFKGQTIIVTGGGSGIGRCTADELAALGAHVVVLGRTIEKLTEVQREIEEDGGQAMSHACVIGAVDAVLAKCGRIDGLVNNAGGQFRSPLKAISTKGFNASRTRPRSSHTRRFNPQVFSRSA
jgi:citronellol/citronellal dehydrogenase